MNAPLDYAEKVNQLENVVPALVQDFKKYYVLFHTTPGNQEYKTMFENIQGNLHQVSSQLISISNDVYYAIENINKQLFVLNQEIETEKDIHRSLEQKVQNVENKNNASVELISDYTKMYNYCYMRNWALLLSLFVLLMTIGYRK
jgi:hypothetical protein